MATLWARLSRLRPGELVAIAAVLRLALIAWAEYQDAHFAVKYTDIDYAVFTDAARFVAAGGSPYQRATYRYSPLLACLALANVWLHPAAGKVNPSAPAKLAARIRQSSARRPHWQDPRAGSP
jgi:phosphatidylinositol glycan class M